MAPTNAAVHRRRRRRRTQEPTQPCILDSVVVVIIALHTRSVGGGVDETVVRCGGDDEGQ